MSEYNNNKLLHHTMYAWGEISIIVNPVNL